MIITVVKIYKKKKKHLIELNSIPIDIWFFDFLLETVIKVWLPIAGI